VSAAGKAIFDTNVFVDYARRGGHADLIERAPHTVYLSAVVRMELLAGADTPRTRRVVASVLDDFVALKRVVAPTAGVFERAGALLQMLRAAGEDVRRASFVNDLLIALTAREIGATVFTADRDFARLRDVVGFELEILR